MGVVLWYFNPDGLALLGIMEINMTVLLESEEEFGNFTGLLGAFTAELLISFEYFVWTIARRTTVGVILEVEESPVLVNSHWLADSFNKIFFEVDL